jgi:hypothetical protein
MTKSPTFSFMPKRSDSPRHKSHPRQIRLSLCIQTVWSKLRDLQRVTSHSHLMLQSPQTIKTVRSQQGLALCPSRLMVESRRERSLSRWSSMMQLLTFRSAEAKAPLSNSSLMSWRDRPEDSSVPSACLPRQVLLQCLMQWKVQPLTAQRLLIVWSDLHRKPITD